MVYLYQQSKKPSEYVSRLERRPTLGTSNTRPLRHKAYRLVTGALKLCSLVVRHKISVALAASLAFEIE